MNSVKQLYRKVGSQQETCPYGESHHVGIYDIISVTIVAEGEQADVSGYSQVTGPVYWAADSEGRVYFKSFNAEANSGWRRDDGKWYFERPYVRWARDTEGRALTKSTPEWSVQTRTDGVL